MKLVIVGRPALARVDNETRHDPRWTEVPGSFSALARLHREGYRVVMLDVAYFIEGEIWPLEPITRVHARVLDAIRHKGGELDAIVICPHAPDENCACRPPNSGLLTEISDRLKVNLLGVPVVCQDARLATAARAVHATSVLLGAKDKKGNGFADFSAFADFLLAGEFAAQTE
jgi:D-glycero-D-manno-heptose 1,7-bisphosphate phosphatase